MIINIKAMLI